MSAAYKIAPVVSLQIVRDRSVRYPVDASAPANVASLARTMIGSSPVEVFVAIAVNGRHKVLSVSVIAQGGVASCAATLADVFRPAIVAGASGVILSHNHPSGDVTPSPEDLAFTRKAIEAGKILGVQVVDHVIVSDTDSHSMFALGEGGFS